MISLSLSGTFDPRHQQRFAESGALSVGGMCETICSNIWSPIIWAGGVRTKKNFVSADYMVLDFDGTMPLSQMQDFCISGGIAHIIGTTKSHQKEKPAASGKLAPALDRFRVVFKANATCRDVAAYEYNLGILTDYFGCDASCTDAARFFYPCKEVVSRSLGKSVGWLEIDPSYMSRSEGYKRRRIKNAELGKMGVLPLWIRHVMDDQITIPEGERHKKALRIGIELCESGWKIDDIWDRLARSKLGLHVGYNELRRHLENGYRMGNG